MRALLAKSLTGGRKTDEDLDRAIRQIISKAMVSDEVIDIFAAAGLKRPDISILSDEFLSEVRGMPQRNLAVELLEKFQNRAIEMAKVVEELIQLAKDMRKAGERGEQLGLTEDILRKYGYRPDKQEKATQTVLEQAELLSGGWREHRPSSPKDRIGSWTLGREK